MSGADAQLLAELDELLDIADPVPADLVDRVRFAIDLENLDVEVARWERSDELAGVRSKGRPSTITFTVEDLTVMVSLSPGVGGYRFDGWLVPGGPHTIEVRVDGHGSTSTAADEGGRFALTDVPRGLTQILVHLAAPVGQLVRTVATPTIVL
ncbi:carboxypeptidase regulatory-like domain-containing protein [Gandjariella thermophila]|nr:carboxypeptidase regulatory-like domain-containing protein [Gandjariella thermophila]